MAEIVVDTLSDVVDADDGVTSLREAVAQANADAFADSIVFANGLSGTITLTGGEIDITENLRINGDTNDDGKLDITISGNDESGIFRALVPDTEVVFQSLEITEAGGGFFARGAIQGGDSTFITLVNSVMSFNYSRGNGGAISTGGILNIFSSTFLGNTASSGGGAIYTDADLTIHNSSFYLNSSRDFGGAIDIYGLIAADISSSTFVGNTTSEGGGAINNFSIFGPTELVITNSLFSGNESQQNDDEIRFSGSTPGTMTAINSFFGDVVDAPNGAVTITVDNGGNINGGVDPGFGAFGDNGGPVPTLALLPGSVLIGAGSVAALPSDAYDLDGDGNSVEPLSLDAAGAARVVGDALDIGAFEFPVDLDAPVVDSLTDVVDGDYSAGNLSLREAINIANEGATITFADGLRGTIVLTGGELVLTRDLIIDGDTDGNEAADITISGNSVSRIFNLKSSGTGSGPFIETGSGPNIDLLSLDLTAGYSAGGGGAISIDAGARLDLLHSTVRDSVADLRGGAIDVLGAFTAVGSTISANLSDGSGGGVSVYGGSATFINTTIAGNEADVSGGGVFETLQGSVTLVSSTVTDNVAGRSGGGILMVAGIETLGASTLTITNSVVAGNSALEDDDVRVVSVDGFTTATNSFFGTMVDIDADGGGNINGGGDAGLAPLADNGGPVQTLALLAGSRLIGAGDRAVLPADPFDLDRDGNLAEPLTLDANGNARILGARLDIGAAEFTRPAVSDFNGNGVSDILLFDAASNVLGQFSIDPDSTPTWRGIGTGGTGWQPAGTGDFDGDGDADILWHNPTTGQLGQFEMTNNAASWAFIGFGAIGWGIAGVGDIGGDGTDDILWFNPTTGGIGQFEMSDGQESWRNIGVGAIGWDAVGLGDLDGDGDEDILWFNEATGGIGFFEMESGAPSWRSLGTGAAGWTVAGIGDFNADEIDDILWFNDTTRTLGQFQMDGGVPTWLGIGQTGIVPGGWDIASISDLNGDGTDDILLQEVSTGDLGQFRIDDGQPTWDFITIGSPSWSVVDPEDGGSLF